MVPDRDVGVLARLDGSNFVFEKQLPRGPCRFRPGNLHLLQPTAWAARQLFLEDKIGTIEPGKDADIAVWDHDLYTMPAPDIKNLKCELTIFAGRVVYRDAASPIAIHPALH